MRARRYGRHARPRLPRVRRFEFLAHAKSLFSVADTVRSDDTYTKANGFYDSFSGYWDELVWAATWLYIATNDASYLTKAESYIPNLEREGYQPTDPIKYKWTQS